MFGIFFAASFCLEDRRADPFQLNLCVWNLEYLDRPAKLRSISDNEKKVAKVMYSILSTCDIFVLPGIEKESTAANLLSCMDDNEFHDFVQFPINRSRDVTVLSRIDLANYSAFSNSVEYPIDGSQYQVPKGTIDFSGSFHATYTLHEPVPLTHLISVNFHSNEDLNNISDVDRAIREAQAKSVCDLVSTIDSKENIFVAGTFEPDENENYPKILSNCGLNSHTPTGKKYNSETYTRQADHKVSETIYSNDNLKKNIDVLVYKHPEEQFEAHPIQQYTNYPLTPKWKKFEIIFSSVMVVCSTAFFIWLMIYSREPKQEYTNIN